MEFKIGNVVVINSGGPLMTVEVIEADIIRTVWFKEAELHRDAFDKIALIKIAE